ncbi:MAG: leucine-rich repeat domain-containing protein [Firmicutes bacterium]|nr:leucine-rich repeat domain-containing protein [Bacillota bacterium]
MKKFLTLLLTVALTATLAITGTIAYLTDTDQEVNVMTLGNVQIEQIELERIEQSDSNTAAANLRDFTPAKALMPAVGTVEWATNYQEWETGGSSQLFTEALKNVQDKFVFVKNTGASDAYVRTVIACEAGDLDYTTWDKMMHFNINTTHWDFDGFSETNTFTDSEGNKYFYALATYKGNAGASHDEHKNGVIKKGETTRPSLLQVFLDSTATNDTVTSIDGNGNGTLDILVLSQAVQVDGFATAAEALTAGFGASDATNVAGWFNGIVIPTVSTYEGLNYITTGTTAEVSSAGGDTVARYVLSDGYSDVEEVIVGEGITTLANRSLAKMPTLKSVSLPSTLTTLEEGAFQGSAITEVEIPENVTYIGKQAIGYCPDIEKIVIKAKNVTIGNYVARACANLKEVYIYSDSVTFETGSMYFTNKENADASDITFYVKDQAIADNCYAAFSTSHSYGMLIKSLDGQTEFYNTLI